MFVYVWVGLGFFLSLLTSSYDAINMFFHVVCVKSFFCNSRTDLQTVKLANISGYTVYTVCSPEGYKGISKLLFVQFHS